MKLGRFAEAEPAMFAETEGREGLGPDAENRAWFYEAWGDFLMPDKSAEAKYQESSWYYSIFASWSTSGGEGTARMAEVRRVNEKIESVKGQSL
jgi:hypothetical protein